MVSKHSAKDIEEKLVQKFTFEFMPERSSKHKFYRLLIEGYPPIITFFSRDKKDISDQLESLIAKQLHVRTPVFRDMVSCTVSKDDYVKKVQDDPYPPFDDYKSAKQAGQEKASKKKPK